MLLASVPTTVEDGCVSCSPVAVSFVYDFAFCRPIHYGGGTVPPSSADWPLLNWVSRSFFLMFGFALLFATTDRYWKLGYWAS